MTILVLLFGGFVATAGLLAVLSRVLPADFLAAAVTARSNHSGPARQLGGLAAAPVAVAAITIAAFAGLGDAALAIGAAAGAILLAVLGYLDDRSDLAVGARLGGQFAAAVLLLWFLDPSLRVLQDIVPLPAERALLAVALVWWVNMTNFMDGLDLMVVAGIGVPHAVIALAGAAGLIDATPAILSAAIAGTLFGFTPFNLPPARIFLGDSVSTLVLRGLRGENLFAAHSAHAYQVVRRAGRPVHSIVAEVAVISASASVLAVAALHWGTLWDIAALACGGAMAAASVMRMRRQARAMKG